MKRTLLIITLVLALLSGCLSAARAEDCFTLDVDSLDLYSLNNDAYVQSHLSAQTSGVRVVKYLSDSSELAAPVRLTITRMDVGALIFDKDYGYQSGTFDSDAIYLPYVDSHTVPYLVTLYVGDTVFAMPFMHQRARLSYNGGCTSGVRLGDLDPALSSDWLMGTMIDLNALRSGGSLDVDLCASNSYIVGRATLSMSGESLIVQLGFLSEANVEVHNLSLYVVTDCASMTTADTSRMSQPVYAVGQAVDVSGASSALVYLPMQLSYDPATSLPIFYYDALSADVAYQQELWQLNRSAGSAENAAMDSLPEEAWTEDSWAEDNGWMNNDGWVDAAPEEDWTEEPTPEDDWTDDGWDDGDVPPDSALEGETPEGGDTEGGWLEGGEEFVPEP